MSEDPLLSENLYRYAEANPISFNDPTGEFSQAENNEVQYQSNEIGKTHMHHSIPREIQRALAKAKNPAAKDAKVVGRKGCPSRVPVDADKHLSEVHAGAGGGSYSRLFKEIIEDFTGKKGADAFASVGVDELLETRKALLDLFDIFHPGCV